jgi:hypothetical protein
MTNLNGKHASRNTTLVLSLSEELLSIYFSGKLEGKLIRIRKTAFVLNTKTLFGLK